jgi:hypothetical protein
MVGVTVRVSRPSRSRERSVWVSVFWLTPASRRDSSEYRIERDPPPQSPPDRRGPSLPRAARINATHLSEISVEQLAARAARQERVEGRPRLGPPLDWGDGCHRPVPLIRVTYALQHYFGTDRPGGPLLRRCCHYQRGHRKPKWEGPRVRRGIRAGPGRNRPAIDVQFRMRRRRGVADWCPPAAVHIRGSWD